MQTQWQRDKITITLDKLVGDEAEDSVNYKPTLYLNSGSKINT